MLSGGTLSHRRSLTPMNSIQITTNTRPPSPHHRKYTTSLNIPHSIGVPSPQPLPDFVELNELQHQPWQADSVDISFLLNTPLTVGVPSIHRLQALVSSDIDSRSTPTSFNNGSNELWRTLMFHHVPSSVSSCDNSGELSQALPHFRPTKASSRLAPVLARWTPTSSPPLHPVGVLPHCILISMISDELEWTLYDDRRHCFKWTQTSSFHRYLSPTSFSLW